MSSILNDMTRDFLEMHRGQGKPLFVWQGLTLKCTRSSLREATEAALGANTVDLDVRVTIRQADCQNAVPKTGQHATLAGKAVKIEEVEDNLGTYWQLSCTWQHA